METVSDLICTLGSLKVCSWLPLQDHSTNGQRSDYSCCNVHARGNKWLFVKIGMKVAQLEINLGLLVLEPRCSP